METLLTGEQVERFVTAVEGIAHSLAIIAMTIMNEAEEQSPRPKALRTMDDAPLEPGLDDG